MLLIWSNFIMYLVRAVLKVMPFILWCWPMKPEVDAGGTAVEAEPSCQYSIPCCCCVTGGSRGAVWQHGIWHGRVHEGKVCHWIPSCAKTGTRWHLLMLAECWWRPNSGCEHSEAVGSVFQQCWQWRWVMSNGADVYEHGMQAFVHLMKMHS